MLTGGFSIGPTRTGSASQTDVAAILETLNSLRGTAYSDERGSLVWVENMAAARTIAEAWATCQRFANQFTAMKLTVFLSRWEKIFGITPGADETLNSRRITVDSRFKFFNIAPYNQNVEDLLRQLMGDVFMDTLHIPSALANGTSPGGLTISGGVSLVDGAFSSTIAYLPIRLTQPLYMKDSDFYDAANKFRPFLDAFLPAWMTFNWGRFGVADGLITLPAGTIYVVGTGGNFLTSNGGALVNGDQIEVIDDSGVVQTLTVYSVTDDDNLILETPISNDITAKTWRRLGFFLDRTNLDNSFLNA